MTSAILRVSNRVNYCRWSLLGAFLVAAVPSTGYGGLIVNGDFESQPNFNTPSSPGYTGPNLSYSVLPGSDIPGWTIENGHAVTVHHSSITAESWGGEAMIAGDYTVGTDGEGVNGNNANLYQDFSTTLGATYLFEFDWKRWEWSYDPDHVNPQLQVSLTDTTSSSVLFNGLYSITTDNKNVLEHVTYQFLGTGNAVRLRIQETPQSGINDNSFLVDNFSVEQLNAVPEPASLTLFGLGALGLAFGRKRQRHNCVTAKSDG